MTTEFLKEDIEDIKKHLLYVQEQIEEIEFNQRFNTFISIIIGIIIGRMLD